jgi:hypothetical protein
MRRAVWTGIAAALVLALVPAIAPARIVYEKSIAGVRLDMSKAQVRAVLGRPVSILNSTNEFGPYTRYRYSGIDVRFQGRTRVTMVSTTRRSQRTADGLGVGSTRAQVHRTLHGEQCFGSICQTRIRIGEATTAFVLHNGRVARVDVGYIID